uniref:Uncharacterized protein n=1 Tax=Lepeophtheirus salmonis TaxID=72036 RepID=A0A0K2VFP2_LEPSM
MSSCRGPLFKVIYHARTSRMSLLIFTTNNNSIEESLHSTSNILFKMNRK